MLSFCTIRPTPSVRSPLRRGCAPAGGVAELMETMPEERIRSVLSTIMESGHFSTLEHASYTFAPMASPRAHPPACASPHRELQPAKPALREVQGRRRRGYARHHRLRSRAEGPLRRCHRRRRQRVREGRAGVPAEDARYLLPNAAESKIVITMNVRELLHFFKLRCCNRAQWEIRDMAHRMLELA